MDSETHELTDLLLIDADSSLADEDLLFRAIGFVKDAGDVGSPDFTARVAVVFEALKEAQQRRSSRLGTSLLETPTLTANL